VAKFYSARSRIIPPLPWQTFALPFSDVIHHSDHMLRMACKVLVQHGETEVERDDARILLVVLDAKSPGRGNQRSDEAEGRP
jgi:hypothetical protein